MSKNDIMTYFATNSSNLTPLNIVFIMLLALAGGLIIYIVYKFTCTDRPYNAGFNNGNILLTLITTVIMLMISSNIVISMGMVGALSIVRFRTAVKDSRDTIFLFWSIVMGLCIGSQNYSLAFVSALFIGVVTIGSSLFAKAKGRHTLVIRASGADSSAVEKAVYEIDPKAIQDAVNYYDDNQEWVYTISVKNKGVSNNVENLKNINGVRRVNIVSSINE